MQQKWPMWHGLILGLGVVALSVIGGQEPVEDWGQAARLTARVSFPFLILAYIARPLHQLVKTPVTTALLSRRKWFGLGFAIAHTIHLGALIMALWTARFMPEPVVIVFGGAAYILMFAMAFTSNSAAMKRMGKWWKRLHLAGIHYLWLIFLFAYSGRITQPDTRLLGITTVAIILAAGAIRFTAWRKKGKKAASA